VSKSLFDPADEQRHVRNVTVPTLTPYLPDRAIATGTGVIIAPGGGMQILSVDEEGGWVAEQLAGRGIAAFVLQYRLAPSPISDQEFLAEFIQIFTNSNEHIPGVLAARRELVVADALSAIRLVRQRSTEWKLNRDQIGMLGFSAGGFVAIATTLDAPPDERPSFVAPIYPAYVGDLTVPIPTPPMFLAWATDDELSELIIGSSIRVYEAWNRAGASVEAHAYRSGRHGFGIRPKGTTSDGWFETFLAWMADSKF
jgi:acetyl esterase/lipase